MGVEPHHYRFHSRWRLDCEPRLAYDMLADVASYPSWWPQMRAVRQLDDLSGELRCRSLLPYDLTFVIRRDVEDPVEMVLRARMTGDLAGTSQWSIDAVDGETVAVFDEDVVVRKALVRRAGLLVRPALRFNHDLMMRSGEHGLQRHLDAIGA